MRSRESRPGRARAPRPDGSARDTIFALSSGAAPAGVAVLRVSGPGASHALRALAGAPLPPARRATLRRIRWPQSGEAIDRGLVLWLPGPGSFTGEDCAEFQVHGGRAVVTALLEALAGLPGFRLADPGEFARRAFDHGKLDLTAVEGLADLIAADTEAQRRLALDQAEGGLARLYDGWRDTLLGALAALEAGIDFAADEADVPAEVAARADALLARVADEVARHLDDGRRGERLREGVSVVILGPPNVGKSSLMNQLARRDVAIVSSVAGTTRDLIEVHLDLAGYPVVLVDTAGLRDGADAVEAEGVRRARARAARADVRLVLVDAREPGPRAPLADVAEGAVLAANKLDLAEDARLPEGAIGVSAVTGAGVDELIAALTARVAAVLGDATGGAAVLSRARQREALAAAREALVRARAGGAPELVAEDVRLAARWLGRVVGRVDVEDVLDAIFAEFCIGK